MFLSHHFSPPPEKRPFAQPCWNFYLTPPSVKQRKTWLTFRLFVPSKSLLLFFVPEETGETVRFISHHASTAERKNSRVWCVFEEKKVWKFHKVLTCLCFPCRLVQLTLNLSGSRREKTTRPQDDVLTGIDRVRRVRPALHHPARPGEPEAAHRQRGHQGRFRPPVGEIDGFWDVDLSHGPKTWLFPLRRKMFAWMASGSFVEFWGWKLQFLH